jgi:hypothetical protein
MKTYAKGRRFEYRLRNELKSENGETVLFEAISEGGTPQFLNIVTLEDV